MNTNSDFRNLRPFRHLIRVMPRQKDKKTKQNKRKDKCQGSFALLQCFHLKLPTGCTLRFVHLLRFSPLCNCHIKYFWAEYINLLFSRFQDKVNQDCFTWPLKMAIGKCKNFFLIQVERIFLHLHSRWRKTWPT